MKSKGQGALEILIITGVLILGAVIFGIFFLGQFNSSPQVPTMSVVDEFMTDLGYEVPVDPGHEIDDPEPPEDPDEPELPEEHTFSDLVLILDPETSSLVNQDFNIIARINSNYDSANVDLIEVKKYDEITNSFVDPTDSCKLNGVYASSFSDAGQLTPLDSNHLSQTFTFSCNSPGQYDFLFTVSNDNDSEILSNDLEGSEYFDGKEIEIDTLCLAGQPGEGSGTEEDPKIICTSKELHDVRDHLDWYYVLGQDLDLNHTILSNDPTATWYDHVGGWEPIGNISWFVGNLNGNNHQIKNLYINRPTTNNVGLFSESIGIIKDLELKDVNVTGRSNIGGLIGHNYRSITNCSLTGNVNGENNVGGLIGYNWGSISLSSSNVNVSGNSSVGGLVGGHYYLTISSSYSEGSVSGNSSVGGLVGSSAFSIENSYSKSSVIGNNKVGGLIGFVGWLDSSHVGSIKRSYSTGAVSGDANVGGLVGYKEWNYGSVLLSYWDTQTSGQSTSAGTEIVYFLLSDSTSISATGATGKTTAQMKTQGTFTDWNFTNIWAINPTINNGYPYLRNNPPQ